MLSTQLARFWRVQDLKRRMWCDFNRGVRHFHLSKSTAADFELTLLHQRWPIWLIHRYSFPLHALDFVR